MSYFEIQGGVPLNGDVHISGAKNAALPMLCAALLTAEKCTFENVPDISDIQVLLDIFEAIGVSVSRDLDKKTVTIQAKTIDLNKLKTLHKVKKFRASILMLGPILARKGECSIMQPGGCVIGARPNHIHIDGFTTLGAKDKSQPENLHLTYNRKKLQNPRLLLSEASVTGTENLAIFLAAQNETSEMYFCAAEMHVRATLEMLQSMGAQIEGIGSHHLKITGQKELSGGTFTIPPDGLLAGTYAIAGIITNGDITIHNVNHKELYSFYGPLKRVGANFEMLDNALHVHPPHDLKALKKLQTAIFPGFSTDLQSPFGVLLTQCEGKSMIFETLFENRLIYLYELEKMGAKIAIMNAHQAQIFGKSTLKGTEIQSWDLRAGAAMVLAGLIAEGTTKVTNINYIDRGYENFPETLATLGAKIRRVQ